MTSDEELIARVREALTDYWCWMHDHKDEGLGADALEALDTLARRLEEFRQIATKLCNQYPSYEEFDPLRELFGLPSYFDMLAKPNTQEEKEQSHGSGQ